MMRKGTPGEKEIRLIRPLQEEFPLCERPFLEIGRQLEMEEDEVIALAARLQEEGRLKRLAAVLYHIRVGYGINSMLVWDVPDERVDETAERASALPQVSHCYRRNRAGGFDYNLYTMVHAKTEEDFHALTGELEELIRPVKWRSLRTTKELKKSGMKYFREKEIEEEDLP